MKEISNMKCCVKAALMGPIYRYRMKKVVKSAKKIVVSRHKK